MSVTENQGGINKNKDARWLFTEGFGYRKILKGKSSHRREMITVRRNDMMCSHSVGGKGGLLDIRKCDNI